jgi:hypothetical protein
VSIEQLHGKAAELNRLAAEADGLNKRYGAYLALHDAACMAGNEKEMEERRLECHAMLDAVLDNSQAVHRASRELRQIVEG